MLWSFLTLAAGIGKEQQEKTIRSQVSGKADFSMASFPLDNDSSYNVIVWYELEFCIGVGNTILSEPG